MRQEQNQGPFEKVYLNLLGTCVDKLVNSMVFYVIV